MPLPSEFFPSRDDEPHAAGGELRDRRFLAPQIQEWADYLQAYAAGFASAWGYLCRRSSDVGTFGEAEICRVHELLCTGLYLDAGRWRGHGQMAHFGGRVGADAASIGPELDLLQEQINALRSEWRAERDSEDGVIERLKLIAHYHARLILVHPFRDGNGRVARLIAQWQEASLLGVLPPRAGVPRAIYSHALRALPSDLGPMLNFFCMRHSQQMYFGSSLRPSFPLHVTIQPPGW